MSNLNFKKGDIVFFLHNGVITQGFIDRIGPQACAIKVGNTIYVKPINKVYKSIDELISKIYENE